MKILVTGGAGFIGGHIVDAYLQVGHEVVVVDRSAKKQYINSKVKFYPMDIQDKELNLVFEKEKPDMVNHHAAQTDVKQSLENPNETIDCNIGGTINILENARKYGVKKIIFSSSAAVYGDQSEFPIQEDAEKRIISPYGVSKYGAELYIMCYARLYPLSYTIFRYANVYGPRQQNGVLVHWIRKLLTNKPCVLFGDGKQTRDFVFVRDIVEANVLALTKGDRVTVNIGTGQETALAEAFAILKNIHSSGSFIKQDQNEGEILRSVLSNTKAKKELGWSPKTTLKDGLKETYEWIKQNAV